MSGLKAIFLYNSYLRGLKTRIFCEGHTNLGGQNGVGKTSALKLIPIFFGQEPSRVMERSASKVSFVDYYLPNFQSMIVFEYTRLNGETCCAVFYRPRASEGQAHAHRFVKGSAEETIFHPSLDPLYAKQEDAASILSQGLKDLDVCVSQQHMYTSHYRDVISNTASMSTSRQKSSQKTASLRDDSRRFSLGGIDDRIQHMHELTSVTLDPNRLTSRLKKMILDTQLKDKLPPQDYHSNAENASTWRDIDSLHSFWKAKPALMQGVETYSQVIEARNEIASYLNAMHRHIESVRDDIDKKSNLLVENKRNREEAEEKAETRQREVKSLLSTFKSEARALEHEIDSLYAERDKWEEKGIDEIAQRYSDLPALRQDLEGLRETLDVLRREGKEAERSYDQDRSAAFERLQKRLEPLEQDKEKLNLELNELKSRQSDDLQALRRQWEEEIQEAISSIDTEIANLQLKHSSLMQELDQAGQKTPEEEKARSVSIEAIMQAENAYETTTLEYQECLAVIQEASQELQEKESLLVQAESALKRADDYRDLLHKKRYPDDNTLLAYLRQNYPEWGDSLGKVINTDLLQSKDLQPNLVNEDQTLYGLSLNLSALKQPDESLEDEKLERLLMDAGNDSRLQRINVEEAESVVKKARQKLNEQNQRQVVLRKRQTSEKERLASLREADRELAKEQREAIQVRQKEIRHKAESLKQQIKEAQEHKSARRMSMTKQSQNEQINLKGQQAEGLTRLNEAVKQKQELIEKTKRDHKDHLLALKSSLDRALTEGGVDTKARDAAEHAVDKAVDEIEMLEGFKDDIAQYQHWLHYIFSGLEEKTKSLREVRSQYEAKEKELCDLEHQAQITRDELKEIQAELKRTLAKLGEQDEAWETLIQRGSRAITSIPTQGNKVPLINPDHLGDGPQVAKQLDTLSRRITQQIDSLRKVSEKCRGIINGHPNTQVHQAWRQMHQRLVSDEDIDSYSVEMDIASMQALSDLMNERLPEIERVLTQSVRAIAGYMVKHHEKLKTLNNSVNQVSRNLRTKLNTEHNFPAISDIQVQLVSLIGEDEQWKPLSVFSKQWESWLASHPKGLPDGSLLKELRQLDEAFRNTRGGSRNIEDLVELEIQLTENGRVVPIRNNKDFSDASSAGLSLIALLIIFSGLTRYLCPNEDIAITWPIDELGRIDAHNVQRLFAMMRRRNIHIFCAQPSASPEMLRRFDSSVTLDKEKGAMIISDKEKRKTLNPRFLEANAALEVLA